jgi:MoaA/NifB/PqqE/SkfB family radical SAM enzyme
MNKTFCILPFTHIATERNGNYLPCCSSLCKGIEKNNKEFYNVSHDKIEDVWTSEYMRSLRNDLLTGVKNSNCQRCWDLEEKGFVSRRQISNKNIIKDISNFNSYTDLPYHLDIKTGNLCNLKCITCNQLASSQHEKEIKEIISKNIQLPSWLKEIEHQSTGTLNLEKVEGISNNLLSSLSKSESLLLQGGEPLINDAALEIIDKCIEIKHTDVYINLMTNLITYDKSIFEKISKFNNHSIMVSWDHVESEKFRFIRYPGNYEHFSKNLEKLIEFQKIRMGISFTLSIFNIFDLEKIFDTFEETASTVKLWAGMNMQLVLGPPYFSIQYLEHDQKILCKSIIRKLVEKNYKTVDDTVKNKLTQALKILDFNDENFSKIVKERTKVLKMYDSLRKTDYKSMFSYIKDYD